MKVLLLLVFAGAVASSYIERQPWTPGKEYVYEYKTRSMTGIPGVKPQVSGIGLKGKLKVQAKTHELLVVKLMNVEYAETNEKVPSNPSIWRQELPMQYRPLSDPAMESLKEPFVVNVQNGLVEGIRVQPDEPIEIVNIKRGIASQLSINMGKANQVPIRMPTHPEERDEVNEYQQLPKEESFFVVEEDSIGGKCKVHYTVTPLQEFLAVKEEKSLPQEIQEEIKRLGGKPLIVTKMRDYENCERKPYFMHTSYVDESPAPCNPSETECKQLSTRTAVTRFLIRGEPEKFRIERVWTESQLLVQPYAHETEKIWVVTNQTLSLLKDEPITTIMPIQSLVPNPIDLKFEFPVHPSPNPYKNVDPMVASVLNEPLPIQSVYSHEHRNNPRPYPQPIPADRVGLNPYPSNPKEHSRFARSVLEEPRPNLLEPEILEPRPQYPGNFEPNPYEPLIYEPNRNPKPTLFNSQPVEPHFSPKPKHYPSLYEKPVLSYFETGLYGTPKLEVPQVIEQINKLLESVEKDIDTFDNLVDKDTSLKIAQMARAISLLNYDEIIEMYQTVLPNEPTSPTQHKLRTKKSLILDAITMSGTNPAVMVLKKLISEGKIKGEKAAQLLMTLPATIRTPTKELQYELIKLVQSPVLRQQPNENKQVYYSALLAVSNLIHRSCVSEKAKKFNFPSGPFNKPYCSKNAKIITQVLLPFLQQELHNSNSETEKFVIIQALGNIGHPHIIKILKPYVEGLETQSVPLRSKAIFALTNLAKYKPAKVFTYLRPIFADPKEHYEIRMSAFEILMKTEPPKSFFTTLASSSWFEPSQQLGSYVFSTLRSLANSTVPHHHNLSHIAQMVLPMHKKFELGPQYSHNYFFKSFLEKSHVGNLMKLAWFSGTKSPLPRSLYTRLSNLFGGQENNIFEMSLHTQGIQELINKILLGKESVFSENKSIYDFFTGIPYESIEIPETEVPCTQDCSVHPRKIRSHLNIVPRQDEPIEGSLHVKLLGTMERIFTFNKNMLLDFLTEGTISMRGTSLDEGLVVNFQKALPIFDTSLVMPTECGLPVFYSFKAPAFVSIRGEIIPEIQPKLHELLRGVPPSSIKLKVDLKPVFSYNRLVEVGVISPFVKKSVVAGVNTHVLVSAPGRVHVEYRPKENYFRAELEPSSGRLPSKVDVFHVRSTPFTSIKKSLDFTPIPLSPETKKIERPQPKRFINEIPRRYPLHYLGVDLEVINKPTFPDATPSGYARLLKEYMPEFMSEYWTMTPTLRPYEFRLSVNPSPTKKIQFVLSKTKTTNPLPVSTIMSNANVPRQPSVSVPLDIPDVTIPWTKRVESFKRFFNTPLNDLTICEDESQPCPEWVPEVPNVRVPTYRRQPSPNYPESLPFEEELGREHTWTMKLNFIGSRPKVFEAVYKYITTESETKPVHKLELIRSPIPELNLHNKAKICVESLLRYPHVPVSREDMLNTNMATVGHLSLRYGEMCEKIVNSKLLLTRSEEMYKHARESPESIECQKLESQGINYAPICKKARHQATALNKLTVEIEPKHPLPVQLLNFTQQLDDYLKYMLYPYLSNNVNVRNSPEKVRITLETQPATESRPWPAMDLKVKKPTMNTFYKSIRPFRIVESVFPLNAKVPVSQKLLKNIFGKEITPTCKIESSYIRTYDNVSYEYPLEDCWHLITKDCSKKHDVAVLAKDSPNGKVVKILVEGQEVILAPLSPNPNKPEIEIQIDGKPIPRSQRLRKSFITPMGSKVEINSIIEPASVSVPTYGLKVISNGRAFQVELSSLLKGRTCGLCGDMNGEKYAELRGPQNNCAFTSPIPFGNSYAIRDQTCKRIPRPPISGMNVDEKCYPINPRQQRPNIENPECTELFTSVIEHNGHPCFSVHPVPRCKLSKCRPNKHIAKKIAYHCIKRGNAANELMSQAQFRVLHDFARKPVDFYREAHVPDFCMP